jgi:hypothetical protein
MTLLLEGEQLGIELADMVASAMARATTALREEVASLRSQIAELRQTAPQKGDPGERGADGMDGRDAPSADDLRPIVLEMVAEAVAAIPGPKDGRDGVDGKDGQPGAPGDKGDQGERGERGEQGAAGEKGEHGRDGKDAEPVTDERLQRIILGQEGEASPLREIVKAYFEAFPPQAGKDGADGRDGLNGRDGRDAADLGRAFKDDSGQLILTLTNGDVIETGIRDGMNGRDGTDGKDGERGPAGFSLDSFDTEMKDGGRTLVLKFASGETVETHDLHFDALIYRGVFKDGQTYERGDMVTWGGSLWHCDEMTGGKPIEGGKSWTLAAKKGRDGKDGKNGDAGPEGKKGEPGKDGRSWG